ncbi:unnamed protein product [Zymoseptoria tritici ST99CH_1A5]|nr:unnamed protein product [Zymoseptoria tritici ST99CH_1A5]
MQTPPHTTGQARACAARDQTPQTPIMRLVHRHFNRSRSRSVLERLVNSGQAIEADELHELDVQLRHFDESIRRHLVDAQDLLVEFTDLIQDHMIDDEEEDQPDSGDDDAADDGSEEGSDGSAGEACQDQSDDEEEEGRRSSTRHGRSGSRVAGSHDDSNDEEESPSDEENEHERLTDGSSDEGGEDYIDSDDDSNESSNPMAEARAVLKRLKRFPTRAMMMLPSPREAETVAEV